MLQPRHGPASFRRPSPPGKNDRHGSAPLHPYGRGIASAWFSGLLQVRRTRLTSRGGGIFNLRQVGFSRGGLRASPAGGRLMQARESGPGRICARCLSCVPERPPQRARNSLLPLNFETALYVPAPLLIRRSVEQRNTRRTSLSKRRSRDIIGRGLKIDQTNCEARHSHSRLSPNPVALDRTRRAGQRQQLSGARAVGHR